MELCVLNYGKFVSIRTNNGYNDLRLFMNSFSLHNINVIIAKCNLSNWENLFAIYSCFVNENMKSLFCNCARCVLCYFYHFFVVVVVAFYVCEYVLAIVFASIFRYNELLENRNAVLMCAHTSLNINKLSDGCLLHSFLR